MLSTGLDQVVTSTIMRKIIYKIIFLSYDIYMPSCPWTSVVNLADSLKVKTAERK